MARSHTAPIWYGYDDVTWIARMEIGIGMTLWGRGWDEKTPRGRVGGERFLGMTWEWGTISYSAISLSTILLITVCW